MSNWTDQAQCLGDETEVYWVTVGESRRLSCGDRDRVAAVLERGSICDGCPVMVQCARDVLECPAEGTIRAGIPVPLVERSTGQARAAVRLALEKVAAGRFPAPIARRAMLEALDAENTGWRR